MKLLLPAVFMLFAVPAIAIGVDADVLKDPAQEARARALMQELRCLVCQNQSIADSDAELAVDLRHVVRERVAAGDSNEDIKTYLVDRYGNWVLLEPPVKAATLLLWLGPLAALLGAALVLWRRTARAALTPEPLTDAERAALDKLS